MPSGDFRPPSTDWQQGYDAGYREAQEDTAIAAEADRGTGDRSTPCEWGFSSEDDCNVIGCATHDSAGPFLDLASPDTVDVVARVPLFQRIVDDTSTLESYEEVAAALIEAIRQEMTK